MLHAEYPVVASDLVNAMRDLHPTQVCPVNERLWVERIPPPEQTAGGLHIPDQARNEHNYCIVRRVADDCDVAKAGDVIICDAYSGNAAKFGQREFLLIDKDQVRATLTVSLDSHAECSQE